MIRETWYDPCPQCGGVVTGCDGQSETIKSNPMSVISSRNPACRYDDEDPDSPDCTCTAIANPCPDPFYDETIVIGMNVTLHPCEHVLHYTRGAAGAFVTGRSGRVTWKIYQRDRPEPNTLGELMQMWSDDA